MQFSKASPAVRLFLLIVGAVIWGGIALTGFHVVHWLLYLPAVFLVFAAVTGICPGLMITRWLTHENPGEVRAAS